MSFIDTHDFPAGLVLRVLGIPESSYYDWRARRVTPSRRELDDAALALAERITGGEARDLAAQLPIPLQNPLLAVTDEEADSGSMSSSAGRPSVPDSIVTRPR